MSWTFCVASPVGPLRLIARADGALTHLLWVDDRLPAPPGADLRTDVRPFEDLIGRLQAYFDGARPAFDVPLAPAGTPFQRDAWMALRDIPYGHTRSYAEQAAALGRPRAIRAVGAANGRNPIAIVVPCHRVVGSRGGLTGYGGGLDRKRWLLEHERRQAGEPPRGFAGRPRVVAGSRAIPS